MKTPKRPPLESLHHALKSWDPVRREGVPPADEVARWRRRMLAAEAERRRMWRLRWRPALATLAAVLALVVLREGGRRPLPQPPVESPAGRAVGGEEGIAGQGGTVAGMPTAGSAEPGALARGEQTGDEEGGRAGERVGRVRRHAAASPDVRRPSAVDPLAEDQPEVTADRAGTPWGDSPLQSIAPPGAAGPPDERTAVGSADEAAQESAGQSAAVRPADGAGAGPPLAASPPTLPSRGPAAGAPPAPAEPPAFREVQIIAPGGTRIVWLIAADPVPTDPSSQEDT